MYAMLHLFLLTIKFYFIDEKQIYKCYELWDGLSRYVEFFVS